MRSIASEVVPLKQNVVVTEAVEEWLADLSTSMVKTLSAMLVRSASRRRTTRHSPRKSLSLADQVHFSEGGGCHHAWCPSGAS